MITKNDGVFFDYAYENMFDHFGKYTIITDSEKELLKYCFRVSYYPKNTFFLTHSAINKQIGFLVEGSAINYYTINDKNIINKFYLENSFIGNTHDFITQAESDSNIQFCESSVILEFDYFAYLNIKVNFPKIADIIYGLQNDELLFYKRRLHSMQMKNSKDRLRELLLKNHDILNRFKKNHIAAYLGIEHETLSRMKGKVVSQRNSNSK